MWALFWYDGFYTNGWVEKVPILALELMILNLGSNPNNSRRPQTIIFIS